MLDAASFPICSLPALSSFCACPPESIPGTGLVSPETELGIVGLGVRPKPPSFTLSSPDTSPKPELDGGYSPAVCPGQGKHPAGRRMRHRVKSCESLALLQQTHRVCRGGRCWGLAGRVCPTHKEQMGVRAEPELPKFRWVKVQCFMAVS